MQTIRPIVAAFSLVALSFAVLCWAELCYRLYLYHAAGSVPFFNHVDDGYFTTMYRVSIVSCGIFLIVALLRRPRSIKALSLPTLGVLANVGHIAALMLAHRSSVIVTYGEWATKFGP